MMKKTLSLVVVLLCALNIIACTTFLIHANGQTVFGRNYDWISDSGMLFSNQRGLQKTSVKAADGNTITCTSKFGSLTSNQYGKEFPTGGMNVKDW